MQVDVFQKVLEVFPTIGTLFLILEHSYLTHIIKNYEQTDPEAHLRIISKILANSSIYPLEHANTPLYRKRNIWLKEIVNRFPDVSIPFARQLILQLKHDHVNEITEHLLSEEVYPKREIISELKDCDLFRSESYISSSKVLLLNEFSFHYESTVNAVMAECNNDFIKSRAKMLETPAHFLWTSVFPFMRRRKISIVESLQDELLKNELLKYEMEKSCKNDHKIAHDLNFENYEEEKQLISCKCCYEDYAFEDLVQCNDGHLFCKSCIEAALNEGLYSSGSLRGKPMKCMESESECNSEIPEESLKVAVPKILFDNYKLTLFVKAMKDAKLNFFQCPFCPYAEEISIERHKMLLLRILKSIPKILNYCIQLILSLLVPLSVLFLESDSFLFVPLGIILHQVLHIRQLFNVKRILYFLGFFYIPLRNLHLIIFTNFLLTMLPNDYLEILQNRISRSKIFVIIFNSIRPRPQILNCKKCFKASCIECKKEFKPIHVCHEKEQDSLRLCIENAMSDALVCYFFILYRSEHVLAVK